MPGIAFRNRNLRQIFFVNLCAVGNIIRFRFARTWYRKMNRSNYFRGSPLCVNDDAIGRHRTLKYVGSPCKFRVVIPPLEFIASRYSFGPFRSIADFANIRLILLGDCFFYRATIHKAHIVRIAVIVERHRINVSSLSLEIRAIRQVARIGESSNVIVVFLRSGPTCVATPELIGMIKNVPFSIILFCPCLTLEDFCIVVETHRIVATLRYVLK